MAQLNTRLVLRNDTIENWTAADSDSNLILLKGEIGISYDEVGKVRMKVGDGTTNWTALNYFGGEETKVYQVDSYDNLPTSNVTIGDIGIVKILISEDKYSYTGYIYTEHGWVAMDGNYNAENVYFDENIVVTQTVGNVETSNNAPVEIACQGKNIKQLFEILYSTEDLDISIDTPSVNFTISSNGTGEVGMSFTRPSATLSIGNIGSYEYGSKDKNGNKHDKADTGITFDNLKVAGGVNTQAGVTDATTSMTEKTNKDYTIGESVVYTATESDIPDTTLGDSKITYNFAYIAKSISSPYKPITNLGNFKKSDTESTVEFNEGIGSINEKIHYSTQQWSAQGTRYGFWGYKLATAPLSNPAAITSAEVRNLPAGEKDGYKGGKSTTAPTIFKIPAGTKQVFFVFPKGKKNNLSIVNKSALSAPVSCTKVSGGGTASEPVGIWVEGANSYAAAAYDLWYVNVDGQFGNDAELGLTWS